MPLDKQLHFLGCFVVAAALYMILGNVWIGVGAAALVGVAKEVIDSRTPLNYFSWADIIADFAGIAAFLCCYFLGRFF